MDTRSSSNLHVVSPSNPLTSNPKRRNLKRSKQPFILEESPIDTMFGQRTMAELLRAPTEGTTNLHNEISNFQQQFDESFHEAWDRYKDLLHACPHHGFTELHQLDTFYNALNSADQDSLNSVAGGNLLERQIAKLTHAVKQQTSAVTTTMTAILKHFQATPPPAFVKAVKEICVTYGAAVNYNQGNSVYRPPGSGSLPSNIVANPKGEIKAITTRSGLVLDGPSIPTPPYSLIRSPLILGRPFLRTARALIDVHGKEMILRDEGGNVLLEKLLDLDFTKDLHLPLYVNPLSDSTTYSSSPNQLLEEFIDELALTTFPPKYNDDLQFDIESDLKEIEYLLHHDPIKDIDSSLKDSIDQNNLADLNDNLVDSMPEMFTDEHALDYSPPSLFDEYDDDLFEVESNSKNVYDDPFDSKGEKIKESKILIDELDLSCDFLLPFKYDLFHSEDFSRVDVVPSTNNKDKLFNPGCQKPGHLAARLGCAETKFVIWDDLAFKLITFGWNVKHENFCKNVDPRGEFRRIKPEEDADNKLYLEEHVAELDKGQAGSDPGKTPKSRPPPDDDKIDEEQARSDPGKSHVILEDPPSSSETLSSMKNLDDTYTFRDQFFNDKSTEDEPGKHNVDAKVVSMVTVPIHQASTSIPPLSTPIIDLSPPKQINQTINEVIKEAIHIALQAPLRDRFGELPEADMKETLHQRMSESGSYKSLPKHVALYEALEASMKRASRDGFFVEKDMYHKRHRDDQDPPPPPPDLDLKQPVEDVPIPDDMNISDLEDTDTAHIPKIKTRPDWLKPLLEEDRPKTLKPDWIIPLTDLPEAKNNWADALAKSYKDSKNIVIRQRVGDLQLGIESYQTKLNLTEPRWGASDFLFKEDYTIISKLRAVIYRDRNNQKKMLRENEVHKFSDELTKLREFDELMASFVRQERVEETRGVELTFNFRMSFQSFAVLPSEKNLARKRVVRSSNVEMVDRYHIVPIEELNGVSISPMARFGVISKSTDRIFVSYGDIYVVGSENHPYMLNKDNYVPWSSSLLCYAKSKPNGKLINNSIMNGPYVRRMIPEPGDPDHEVPVTETFHEQTDDELTKNEVKQMEADDQAIQTILMGLPEDIYVAVYSYETAPETWLCV
nr:reverse transcriptase domain-containing protein [Tanacetum cinerariifolium]